MDNIWKSGIYGLIIGDAMGVPVEFTSREDRKKTPITDMTGYGHIISRKVHGLMTAVWYLQLLQV